MSQCDFLNCLSQSQIGHHTSLGGCEAIERTHSSCDQFRVEMWHGNNDQRERYLPWCDEVIRGLKGRHDDL